MLAHVFGILVYEKQKLTEIVLPSQCTTAYSGGMKDARAAADTSVRCSTLARRTDSLEMVNSLTSAGGSADRSTAATTVVTCVKHVKLYHASFFIHVRYMK